MDIEVICTGDEVLTGKIVNSNWSWIAQKLEDYGLAVVRGQTVGDDRGELLRAFQEAGQRADAVIVNGGLGPTVDDLSQEIAAKAAGVGLVLHEDWLARMDGFFKMRGRTMPENNKKQAMLPEGAEMLDNPVGTACGFAVTIGKARFFFTPGVPRELFRMVDEQIVPRLLQMAGSPGVILLKRFHSFGLGESHVDSMLSGIESLVPDGSVKLGFRAHYPQLETKLTVRAKDLAEARVKLKPVEAEVHQRMGNFILAEDGETLEGNIQALMSAQRATLAVVENFSGGQLAGRLAPLPNADQFFLRGIVARGETNLAHALGLEGRGEHWGDLERLAGDLAESARRQAGATLGLALLCSVDDQQPKEANQTGMVGIAIASADNIVTRGTKLAGHRDWIRLGAVEMGLDCLRRFLQGLPLHERTDFERKPA